MEKIVIALGGNAIGSTPEEQKENVKSTAKNIVDIIESGYSVVLTHGNGPQVGAINLAFSLSNTIEKSIPEMPLVECTALSQGYIGYHIQEGILNELRARGINKSVVSVVTQIEVDINDEAFANPTKPIGRYYSKDEKRPENCVYREDPIKGFRRIVPSPLPVDIIEKDTIKELVNNDNIVICCGGGGIPVYKTEEGYKGVDSVIDKDFASAKLASLIDADKLIILTAIDCAKINYRKPDEKSIGYISVKELQELDKQGHFQAGSMGPKVESCLNFVDREGKEGIITSLDNLKNALLNGKGTHVTFR